MRTSLTFIILFFSVSIFSQTQEHPNPEALFRYWEFRDRLKHFVRLDHWGDGIGEWMPEKMRYEKAGFSLPAAELRVVPQACWYWQYHFDSGYTPPEVLNDCSLPSVLKWGDTPTDLGYYMAMLATEYELLRINGQHAQKEKTLHEIYLALQAYRRLDMTANRFYAAWVERHEPNCENHASQGMCGNFTYVPKYDGFSGFFIRDDVPHEFRHHFNNMAEGDSTWQVGGVRGGLSSSENDPIDWFLPDMNSISGDNILSQDQMIGILFGLSFIHRYIPEDENFLGQNIIDIVEKIAGGMLNHIQPADEIIAAYRSIRYPGCLQDVKVERGHNASNFYYAINNIIANLNPDAMVCTDGEDKQKWEAFAKRACNCNIPFYEFCGYNCRMLLELLAMSDEGDFKRNEKKALESNKEAHMLAWYLLHDDKYSVHDIGREVYAKMRVSLFENPPSCHGPCYRASKENTPVFECENIYGWCGSNRMKNGNFRASSCNYDGNWYVRGGGVGYMLMYNLFMLVYFPNVPYFNPDDFSGELCFDLPNILMGEKSVCAESYTVLSLPEDLIPFEKVKWDCSSNLTINYVDEKKEKVAVHSNSEENENGWVSVKVVQNGCDKTYSWSRIRLGLPPLPLLNNTSDKCEHEVCLENKDASIYEIIWDVEGVEIEDFDMKENGSCLDLNFYVPPPVKANISVNFFNSCGEAMADNNYLFDCDESLPKKLYLTPNPVNEYLKLNIENLSAHILYDFPAKMTISGQYGNVILGEETNESNWVVDVSDLIDGIYFVSIVVDGEIYVAKFIKH